MSTYMLLEREREREEDMINYIYTTRKEKENYSRRYMCKVSKRGRDHRLQQVLYVPAQD